MILRSLSGAVPRSVGVRGVLQTSGPPFEILELIKWVVLVLDANLSVQHFNSTIITLPCGFDSDWSIVPSSSMLCKG